MLEILIFIILFIITVIIMGKLESDSSGLMSAEEAEQWFDNNFKIDKEGWIQKK